MKIGVICSAIIPAQPCSWLRPLGDKYQMVSEALSGKADEIYTHFTSQYKIFLLFNVLSISPWRVTINLPHINLYHQANETSYYYQPGRTDHYSFSCADEMMPRIPPFSISPGHCRASICVEQTPQYCLISFIYPHINSSLMLVITSNFVLQNLE